MKLFTIATLLALSTRLWSEELEPHPLLSKEANAKFQKHAGDAYLATDKVGADLQLPVADQRVLLHLPKRGFPFLAGLSHHSSLYTWANSVIFSPERKLNSYSHEEGIAGELVSRAMVNRVLANNIASFYLIKELAPTPEAMKFEQQAKVMDMELGTRTDTPTEVEFLQELEKVRAFFDQLKDLPKLTPEQMANERTESAVLAPVEYEDAEARGELGAKRKWLDRQLHWQRNWNHQGYLMAFSESRGPQDYMRLRMVVGEKGGIFEWNQRYNGSHFAPDSYESKLPTAELQALEHFLEKMPASDARREEIHFVVSFLNKGQWTTRTYHSLPAGNPFENVLQRMRRQSTEDWADNPPVGDGFLKPLPEK